MIEILFPSLIHSRKREGRVDPNGYSALIKCPDLVAITNLLISWLLISYYCRGNVVQFEVQFIPVHLEQLSTSFCSRFV